MQFKHRNLFLGATAVNNKIDGSFRPQSRVYNQFSALDNDNSNFGIDYNYLFKNVNFFLVSFLKVKTEEQLLLTAFLLY